MGVLNIFKGVGISILITLICLFIFSCLLVYTNISESLMQPVVIVISAISILIGSIIINRKLKKNGVINGAIIGLLYMLLIYLFSSIWGDINFSVNLQSCIMIISGIIGGIIGGIVGVNT